jgi:hypothetical protein
VSALGDFQRRFREAAQAEARVQPASVSSPIVGVGVDHRQEAINRLDRYAEAMIAVAFDKPPRDWTGRDVAALLVDFGRLPDAVTAPVHAFLSAVTELPDGWGRDWESPAMRTAALRRIRDASDRRPNGDRGSGHHRNESENP